MHVHLPDEPLGAVHQEVPCPVAEEQILFHVPLHNGNLVFLVDQFLILHSAAVASADALDVVEDGLDAVLPLLLHTSYSSGPEELVRKFSLWSWNIEFSPEEHLGMANPPLVIHGLDRFENDLSASLQVRHGCVHFLGLDDDEAVDKVSIHRPDKSTLVLMASLL